MSATLTVDYAADVAYLRLSNNPVTRTCEVEPGVLVDLDEFGMVVGVEVLELDVVIPRTKLVTDYHVHHEQVDIFDQIRPNVTTFVAQQITPARERACDRTHAHA